MSTRLIKSSDASEKKTEGVSKKEGRWRNPKPKTETPTQHQRGKWEKERRRREKERGDPSAPFPIRQKRHLSARDLELSTGKGFTRIPFRGEGAKANFRAILN